MPYRRSRRRKRMSNPSRPRIQHSPSEMDGSILTKDINLRFVAVTDAQAGTALGTTRTTSDRFTEIATGSVIKSLTFQVAIRAITNEGYLEYSIVKMQRQHTVPVVGTAPMPSDADVDGSGLESQMRKNFPGWCIHNGIMPFSAETPTTRKFTVNLSKFRMSRFRDGDFLALVLFNRSAATITLDHKCNYYEYK